jgi:hypothetical protein
MVVNAVDLSLFTEAGLTSRETPGISNSLSLPGSGKWLLCFLPPISIIVIKRLGRSMKTALIKGPSIFIQIISFNFFMQR